MQERMNLKIIKAVEMKRLMINCGDAEVDQWRWLLMFQPNLEQHIISEEIALKTMTQ